MSLRVAALVSALAMSIAFGLTAALAHATVPGKNGRIAFERYRLSDQPLWAEIWVTNPDGTGERKVSHSPRGYLDRAPDWAPDGSRIAFQRCGPNDRPCEIWSVKPNGSDERRLSPHCPPGGDFPECVFDLHPAYSPDGKHIAFERDSGRFDHKRGSPYSAAIMVADADLEHARRVAWFGPFHGAPDNPTWSSNGEQIAFTEAKGTSHAIYIVNVDGTGLRRLTPWKLRAGAGPEGIDWSPDGTRILFRTHPLLDDSGGNLYTIRPDGTGLRQLTYFQPYDTSPGALRSGSYSPDGSSIVFATYHGAVVGGGCCNLPDVFVMSADGTDVRPVTRADNWDGDPDWGAGRG